MNNSDNTDINNYDSYISRMNRGMLDKLFFLDKIDVTTFVDFGAGDGELLSCVKDILSGENKSFDFIGYDVDKTMVERGNKRFSSDSNVLFTDEWKDVEEKLSKTNGKSALILSSIIHEIYHYSDVEQIKLFWERVFNSNFDYIIIRDMIPSSSVDRNADVNDVKKVYGEFFNTKPLMDFESIWGSIDNNKNLVHFLLKYKYVEPNWDREVKENYLPIYREKLLSIIPREYDISYHEHFTLPYIKNIINEDFGIELKDNTHLKLILQK